jgi:hypothetical protein
MVGNLEGDWINYRVWFEKQRILRCRLGLKTAIGSHCLQITLTFMKLNLLCYHLLYKVVYQNKC